MSFRAEKMPERGYPTYIRQVPACIRQGDDNSFTPVSLAIGPYHSGNQNLRQMELCKADLIEKSPGFEVFEAEMLAFLQQTLQFYPPEIAAMICRDVFFLVFVIYLRVEQISNGSNYGNCFGIINFDSSWLRSCVRDLFIADNQLPWSVVDKACSLIFGGEENGRCMIHAFLSIVMHGNLSFNVPSDFFDGDPVHLLDLLRKRYAMGYKYPEDDRFISYSAKELLFRGVKFVEAEKGIQFLAGNGSFCRTNATLALPRLIIGDDFQDIFLNMAGFEASPGTWNNGEITKLLCLYRALLRDPESVARMQQKFILCEENAEWIVSLFKKICKNLHPDFEIYRLDEGKLWSRELFETYFVNLFKALGIDEAVKKARIWARELYHIYLSNQMVVETLLGAAIMLILRISLSKSYSPNLGTYRGLNGFEFFMQYVKFWKFNTCTWVVNRVREAVQAVNR